MAAAPGLAWTTNLNAQLFAVDSQTNLYAHSGGTVYRLSAEGVPLQTNTICPLPGVVRRDSAGNYYFAGTFDGLQDFGGISIVGGWTNHFGRYSSGYPTCFLAKYGSNGSLQWVSSFGRQAQVNAIRDLALDPSGGFYASYDMSYGGLGGEVAHLSETGAVEWTCPVSTFGTYAVNLGSVTPSNCCILMIGLDGSILSQVDRLGNKSLSFGPTPYLFRSLWSTNGQPITDDAGNAFQVGQSYSSNLQLLRKCLPVTDIWSKELTPAAEAILARDPQGSIYLAGANGMLAKFSDSGEMVWSNNFGQACEKMVVDASGNRFVSLANGAIARLQVDGTAQPVQISSGPTGQTAFAGDSFTFSVLAVGTEPFFYHWRLNGTNLPGANGSQLRFNALASSDAGEYSVVVSNAFNAVTSAPAVLRVKSVQLYSGNQMLTNGSYVFDSPPTLTIRSAFANGSLYYTLDGSAPSRSSIPCAGPFQLEHNATLRAIGYSADGLQSEEADSIVATVYSQHTLSLTTSGPGSVQVDPAGGVYANTTTVTLRAIPAAGCSFLFWLDDASGSSPITTVSMEYDRYVMAVFATNLPSEAAAPGLAWATNLNAQLFAVDSQTNLYAHSGGTVYRLSAEGVPLQTNTICPLPGVVQRDSAGNYYFAGSFDGLQDFGGISIVGGWTNHFGHYSAGYPTCFLAKYSNNGSLQWVTSFGRQGQVNAIRDLALDPSGGFYASYDMSYGGLGGEVAHLSETGAVEWTQTASGMGTYAVNLGSVTPSNCCILTIDLGYTTFSKVDRTGERVVFGSGANVLTPRSLWSTNGQPIVDDEGNAFQVGQVWNESKPQWLRKCVAYADLWEKEITPAAEAILARDPEGNIYLSGADGMLAKYNNSGEIVWNNNFGQGCENMVVDASGNRFVSLANGVIARLQVDGMASPSFAAKQEDTTGNVLYTLKTGGLQIWQIEASSTLTNWTVLGTVTNTSGGLRFSDPSNAQAPTRFYRAIPKK